MFAVLCFLFWFLSIIPVEKHLNRLEETRLIFHNANLDYSKIGFSYMMRTYLSDILIQKRTLFLHRLFALIFLVAIAFPVEIVVYLFAWSLIVNVLMRIIMWVYNARVMYKRFMEVLAELARKKI